MGKRKRDEFENDEYVDFCSGLQKASGDGKGDNSYIDSCSRPFKRPRINPNFTKPGEVQYRYLDYGEKKFNEVKRRITTPSIIIDDIVEVNNSTLEDAYNVKKKQKIEEYQGNVEEALLFHGTKNTKVGSICRFNFDWRLNGSNRGHKFGKGVCFSKSAKYASSYSDREHFKVMIVAKVLMGRVCQGHHDMSIPPKGYDTSQNGKNKSVLVKYEDNEFFPAYILYYHFRDYNDLKYNSRRYRSRYSYDSCGTYDYDNRNQYSSYNDVSYDCYNERYRYNKNFYYSHNYSDQQNSDYSYDGYYNDRNYYDNGSNHHYYDSHHYYKDSNHYYNAKYSFN